MECLIMTYGRDFEPMAEIFCDSYMILEFYAMSTCWPNVHCQIDEKIGHGLYHPDLIWTLWRDNCF